MVERNSDAVISVAEEGEKYFFSEATLLFARGILSHCR